MIDSNPVRIWFSCMDRIRTSLNLVNVLYFGLSPDWWLFILGLLSISITLGCEPTSPGYWPFAIFGFACVPYILYMPVSFFCHRPHFFTARHKRLGDGTYGGSSFGYWSFSYEVPAFVGSKTTMKTKDASFSWCRGSVTIQGNQVHYDVRARASIATTRVMGILERHLEGATTIDETEIGEATVMFRRVPAIKIREDGFGFLVAITRQYPAGSSI